MTLEQRLKEVDDFSKRFVWKEAGWRGLRIAKEEQPTGDCKTYSWTVAWILSGRSMLWLVLSLLTFQKVIWLGRSPIGESHQFLWVKGLGWIDNIHRDWTRTTLNSRMLPLPVALWGGLISLCLFLI